MKTLRILIPALVLTATLLVGCGCRNSAPATLPTTMPTVASTAPTTEMTTEATTRVTTEATTAPTIEDGNGPVPTDTTTQTDGTDAARSRSGNHGMGSMTDGASTGNGITGSITRNR